MNLEYVPLLRVQRELHGIPPGMGRFRQYLRTLAGQDRLALELEAAVEPTGPQVQRLLDVVQDVDVLRIVEVVDVQEALAVRDALLGQRHRARLLVHDVVARRLGLDLRELALHDRRRALELGDDAVDLVVALG